MAFNFPGDLELVLPLFFDLCFPLTELLDDFVDCLVDGGVEVILRVLRMKIFAWHGNVDLDLKVLFLGAMLVKEQYDMGCQNLIRVLLKVFDFFSHMSMDGCGKGYVTRAEVDLHSVVFLVPFYGRKRRCATKMRTMSEASLFFPFIKRAYCVYQPRNIVLAGLHVGNEAETHHLLGGHGADAGRLHSGRQ